MNPVKKGSAKTIPDKTIIITESFRERANTYLGQEVFDKSDVGKLLVDRRIDFYETPRMSRSKKRKQEEAKKSSKLNASGDGFIGIHYTNGPNKGFEKIIDVSTGKISLLQKEKETFKLILLSRSHLSIGRTLAFTKVLFGTHSLPKSMKEAAEKLTLEAIDEANALLFSEKKGINADTRFQLLDRRGNKIEPPYSEKQPSDKKRPNKADIKFFTER